MTDTVSVIIPTYNCAQRLMQALNSVLAQTLAHEQIEVVVVDDGSTDGTAERVAAFAAGTDVAVRYVCQDNAGPAAARNHGMRLANGQMIAFLDDDDTWLPTKLARQLPLLGGRVGLVYCDNEFVDEFGISMPRNWPRVTRYERGHAQLALFCDFFLLTSAVCIQRACIEQVGYFDERLPVGEDYEYFLRLAAKYEVDFVREKLLVRTIRPDSLSRADYALDARTDLATLKRHIYFHPDFVAQNRAAVRQRMADYRYDFAYRLLDDGRRLEAIPQLLKSLISRPSLRAAKACARLLLPRRWGARPALGV